MRIVLESEFEILSCVGDIPGGRFHERQVAMHCRRITAVSERLPKIRSGFSDALSLILKDPAVEVCSRQRTIPP